MKLFKRIMLHVFGFAIMTFAVSLIVKTEQGAFPYDAISYYLSKIIDHEFVTIGVASIFFGLTWVLVNFIIIKKAYVFWSLIIVFGFGSLMDIWFANVLVHYNPQNHEIWFNALLAFTGLILVGFSLSIIIRNKSLPLAPSEVFLVYLTGYTKKTWLSKVLIETVMIGLALLLAVIAKDFVQIGWFTIVSAFLLGIIISLFEKVVKPIISDY
ncbi:hypothetical protein [Acholeplasma granularum]|uniref:hypothetical protein n=1 Tax=Acholeplasma granularum TaxID=264635 RepID=UPI0004B2AAC2|nr:hypothetical protein [Acholeplasma granularum]